MTAKSATIAKPKRSRPGFRVAGETIGRLSELFRLLADESRLKILLALAQAGELHVTALCGLLDQSQPAVSHHLTLLRMGGHGLVRCRRDGKHNFYRVDSTLLRDLLDRFFAEVGNGHKQFTFQDFSLAYKANGSHPKKR